jgi:hypothetical protein
MPARILLAAVMLCHAAASAAAAVASGRNWRVTIESIECQAAASLMVVGMRIDYLGPSGAVEAPVSQLRDAGGKQHLPRSIAWKPGSKPLAEWLSSGGLRNLKPESLGAVELKFDVVELSAGLSLEFGDAQAFPLARKTTGKGVCASLLKPDEIRAPRAARPAAVDSSKLDFPVLRAKYPCNPSRTVAAEYPPYLPRQLLFFGRGYLPGVRQIELPMGRAPAQSYAYAGPDDLAAVEKAARQALRADFPQYERPSKYFAFNWGMQKTQSGNVAYSIGIYELRRCPGA